MTYLGNDLKLNPNLTFVVLGLGQSGMSVISYLHKKGEKIIVVDTRTQVKDISKIEEMGLRVHLGEMPDACYSKDCVWVVSPGIALEHPWIQKAISLGIRLENDISLFAFENTVPLALITGTNGKSTVTSLLTHLIDTAGISVGMGGNIGIPALSLLNTFTNQDKASNHKICVLEISSFQLEIAKHIKATVATCLNVTPDHIDRHKTMENYRKIKHDIFNNSQWIVANKDDANTIPVHLGDLSELSRSSASHQIVYYHLGPPLNGEWGIQINEGIECFSFQNEFFIPLTFFKMVGNHNKLNALAALAMAQKLGVPLSALQAGIESYVGLEHRCQLACELNGVKWINDSKGTNVDASLVAISGTLATVPGNVYLIAGGDAKGADLEPMARVITERMPLVVLLGKDAPLFESIYRGVTKTIIVKNMEEAVKMLAEMVKPGDAVLLSPACSSLDMYVNFEHRGRHFTELAKGLNCAATSTKI